MQNECYMGATERVGGAALKTVMQKGRTVKGISRRPSDAKSSLVDWASVDALDTSALASAFKGAEAVFVLNPVPVDVHAQADRFSASVAQALRMASVPYVVALSSQGAHLPEGTEIVTALHRFELMLRDTGIPHTFLRPAYFLESWIPLAQVAAETGELPAFFEPASPVIDAVSARDLGMIAAHYLMVLAPGVVDKIGPARYGDSDAAEIAASLSDRPVRAAQVQTPQIAAAHEAAGIGSSFAAETAKMYQALNGPGIPFEERVGCYAYGSVTLREVLQSAV